MNIVADHVAPEEIMAFLDGELGGDHAQSVEIHIDECAECNEVAEQLRETSQSLSMWTVPAIATELDNAISVMASKRASPWELLKPGVLVRMSFWSWRNWALAGGGALAALVIVAGIMLPNLNRSTKRAIHAQAEVSAYEPLNKDGQLQGRDSGRAGKKSSTTRLPEGIVRNGAPALITRARGGGGGGDHDKLGSLGKLEEDETSSEESASAPMIARSASLSIVVKDFPRARADLDALLTRHHGYAAELNANTPENAARSITASLRVPAPELDSAIADFRSLGRVEYESQSGEDVTKEHTDLVARLKTSRDTEQRFRTILEQRPGNVAEVLKVEESIARVRGDIERMQAEQKALEHRVDFASIDLQLTEEFKAALNPPAPSLATRLHNALVAGYENAQETLLGILLFFVEDGPTILIWLAVLALPLLLIWRRFRRMAAHV